VNKLKILVLETSQKASRPAQNALAGHMRPACLRLLM